jgi:hypothetical protein
MDFLPFAGLVKCGRRLSPPPALFHLFWRHDPRHRLPGELFLERKPATFGPSKLG